MEIRKATVLDIDELTLIIENVEQSGLTLMGPGERKKNKEGLNILINKLNSRRTSAFFVVVMENKIVGYLIVRGETAERIKHRAHLMIGVHSEYRKKGIAKALFKFLFSWCEEVQIKKLELSIMVRNEIAYHLCTKLGFVIEGVKKKAIIIDEQYVDEFYMAKYL